MIDTSNYEQLRQDAQNYYNDIGKIYSPALGQDINFTSEGFNHIVYKGPRSEREKTSQILRFKLLSLAIKLVRLSTTHQEFEETLKEFDIKSHKKHIKQSKIVKYWGVIAIIDGRKIKVILRKIGENGAMHFWSIVPDWITNHYRDMRFFTTMKGNPDED